MYATRNALRLCQKSTKWCTGRGGGGWQVEAVEVQPARSFGNVEQKSEEANAAGGGHLVATEDIRCHSAHTTARSQDNAALLLKKGSKSVQKAVKKGCIGGVFYYGIVLENPGNGSNVRGLSHAGCVLKAQCNRKRTLCKSVPPPSPRPRPSAPPRSNTHARASEGEMG
jgi:hypothetical protein